MATANFLTYTPSGVEQLNARYPHLRVVASGSAGADIYGGTIAIPDLWPECPIFMIRPAVGVSVGGFVIFQRNPYTTPQTGVRYQSNGPFDWALASTQGTPISIGPSNVGLKMWDESGRLTFSTQYKYPRIVSIASVPSPPFGNAPMSSAVGMSGWGAMPWIIANDLIYVYEGPDGTGGGYSPAAFAATVNGSLSVLTVEMRSSDEWSPTGFGLQPSYNPYASRPLRLPLCVIPGL
nr:hypothetical protein [Achromobacter ruhlandii]